MTCGFVRVDMPTLLSGAVVPIPLAGSMTFLFSFDSEIVQLGYFDSLISNQLQLSYTHFSFSLLKINFYDQSSQKCDVRVHLILGEEGGSYISFDGWEGEFGRGRADTSLRSHKYPSYASKACIKVYGSR